MGLVFDSKLSIHCIHSMYSGINISQTDARPMYLQIMEQIRARIAVGDWAAGRELPSIRALAAGLSVSVITIKRAYLDLENEGVIVTRHGKGSFVADVNGLAGSLQEEKLDEHLDAAAGIGRQVGLTPEDLAERLRRAIRNLDKK
jgi:GntR family transcriptional regulator